MKAEKKLYPNVDFYSATMFYALGIDPHTQVYGVGNRPVQIADGNPVMDLFA